MGSVQLFAVQHFEKQFVKGMKIMFFTKPTYKTVGGKLIAILIVYSHSSTERTMLEDGMYTIS